MPERILITVKTYPTLSKKYGELVCTAGLREDGSWVRIYPVPFRRLEDYLKYNKWVWIELNLVRNMKDPRPESYKPVNLDDMKIIGEMKTGEDWSNRKDMVLNKARVYDNLTELIELANKQNKLSLAVFRPTMLLDFVVEEAQRDWNPETIEILKNEAQQGDLFASPENVGAEFKVMPRVPFKFSYRFQDVSGKESTMMIEDWEIGQLYWHCLKQSNGDEAEAIELVKRKYFDEFTSKKDIALFLGTTRKFHGMAPNPFVIVGVFYPPASDQMSLPLS